MPGTEPATSGPTTRSRWGRLARPKEASMAQVPLLERLGLHRPELRAWAMYDWANSVFMPTGLLIFPIYLADVASAGSPVAVATARYSMVTTVSMALVAVLTPILGAIADYTAMKKKMLAAFALMGILA